MSPRSKGISGRYPIQLILPVVDTFFIVSGSLFAYWLRFTTFIFPEEIVLSVLLLSMLTVLLNGAFGEYNHLRNIKLSTLILRQMLVWSIVIFIVVSVIYFSQSSNRYSRLWVFYSLSLTACCTLQ